VECATAYSRSFAACAAVAERDTPDKVQGIVYQLRGTGRAADGLADNHLANVYLLASTYSHSPACYVVENAGVNKPGTARVNLIGPCWAHFRYVVGDTASLNYTVPGSENVSAGRPAGYHSAVFGVSETGKVVNLLVIESNCRLKDVEN